MAFSQSSSSPSASPNVTPLIDVLLVLLIIFMVIVPVTPRGLNASIPQASTSRAPVEKVPIVVEVLPRTGGGVVYRVGARSFDTAGLLHVLKQACARSAQQEIYVAGDPRLDYQPIAATVAAAHAAGFHVVGLMHGTRP